MTVQGKDAVLAAELLRMGEADHAAQAAGGDVAGQLAWRRLTARHGDRLRALLELHGRWPVPALVGEDAARSAWLLAQHADRQLDVQRLALRLLEGAVAAGEAGGGCGSSRSCATARW